MNVVSWIQTLAVAIAIYALLAFAASRMVYFPTRYPDGNWSAAERIGADDVFIQEGLHAWFARVPGSDIATLHLHGNAGNITYRVLSAQHILAAGSSVLLLDYRGYGRSTGRPTEQGLYEDALAAFDWLQRAGYRRIVLHGESLGTAVAAEVALRRKSAGIVLEAPFPSAGAVAGHALPLVGRLLMWGYDTRTRIARVNVPVLVVHGDRDEVIPYHFGQEVYRAACEPKSLWTIPGAMHNDIHLAGAREFPERLRAFYQQLPD